MPSGDRISALPDALLHRILSFLPAQQAARTCVLARRWIDLWKSATGLRIVGADGESPVRLAEVREFVDHLLLFRGNLCLIADAKMFIFRRDLKWCPTYRQLKTCVLNEHWCVPDVRALACILKHSPVLEELSLLLFSEGPKHNVEMKGSFNPNGLPPTISAYLKKVGVKCERVDERVVQVLRFLGKLNISLYFQEKVV